MAVAFYDFVLQIRPQLHELHQLREIAQEDIIENVCAKIPQEEQDSWNRSLHGQEEARNMRKFVEWLFERALAKPNIEELLEERYEKAN